MGTFVDLLAAWLVFAFVLCCVVSGMLQLFAWTRHARRDVPFSVRALTKPEEYFDGVGLRQILLARRVLTVGGVAYLSYGVLIVASNVLR